MAQRTSWKFDSSSSSQEVSRLLLKLKIQYHDQKKIHGPYPEPVKSSPPHYSLYI
jgi:hypothetical protein